MRCALAIILVCLAFTATSQSGFEKIVVTDQFVSEGVATADVNRDGRLDILAGTHWFEAPSWIRHEIVPGRAYNPETDYSHSFLNFSDDVNRDGWVDLIVVDFPGTTATWYENPGRSTGFWRMHPIFDQVTNESPAMADLDGDGRLDLICGDGHTGEMIWLRSVPSGVWPRYSISQGRAQGTDTFSHGLGTGDVNRDGRTDVVIREGWWEGPIDPAKGVWKFHEAPLGDQCSQMYVDDVNGDGLNDILSASAHLSGVWWHEQLNENGVTSWETHVISYAFAESHSLVMTDLNSDGRKDLITGKRNLKRNTWRKNPGTHGPPLLYWFERTAAEPYWIAHEIDQHSGAGLNHVVTDMNGDGRPDIVIANFKGVFLFVNQLP